MELTFDWRDPLPLGLRWFEESLSTDKAAEVAKITGPILAINGLADTTVTPDNADQIVAASKNENSRTYFIENCDHTFNVFSGDDTALTDAIYAGIGFLENTFNGGIGAGVTSVSKYGNVTTNIPAYQFAGAGFELGDILNVTVGDTTVQAPYGDAYSNVDNGNVVILADGDGYVTVAINMGNFAETYELAKKHTNEDKTWYWTAWEGVTYPVEVTFKMAEKGGYMAEYIMHDLQRTNDRADYPNLSDAEFGNFRNIATTGMGKDVLYRGSSPINPELGRNTYVDAALKQAGVNVIMNLANSQEEAEAYEGFADTYYSGQKVIYLNLGVDFSAPEFQKGLAEGLRFFAANKGTYYVHCTEGKDRAGFVSALLECLMGATYDEVVADYMVTYYNYYGVEPGTDKYDAIANSNIIKTLQNAFGVEDLSKADLQKGAKDYMKAIGLTDAEITDLMVNLGYVAPVEPVTPSKPATGDAGIVVYLGLGVMALAGGVLVAKKKEQF